MDEISIDKHPRDFHIPRKKSRKFKRGIILAHLAAGTRSFDINMPKEINRLVIDGLSDYLFTAGSGIGTTANPSKIYDVGNILIDTLRTNLPRFKRPQLLEDKGIADSEYIVLTINRKSLIASGEKLDALVKTIEHKSAGVPIIAPLRKDAQEKIANIHSENINFVEPLSYLIDFLE